MPTAENAQIYYEAGVDPSDTYIQLSDIGDNLTFRSAVLRWSRERKPIVRPNGLRDGGIISVGTGSDNVQVAAGTVYIGGEELAFPADIAVTVWRGATTDIARVTSVQARKASAGVAEIVSKPGIDSTAFSTTRGAAGAPPLIGHKEVEIGQVRVTSVTTGAIVASELYSDPGTHTEWYNYPNWEVNYSYVANKLAGGAGITFDSALPDSHNEGGSGGPKHVYAYYYVPSFAKIGRCVDHVCIETSWSNSSAQVYDGKTIGAASSSLGQGSFTAYTNDNITDNLVAQKNKDLWFKYLQDSTLTTTYTQSQGRFGIARNNPANDNISLAGTISGEEASDDVNSEATLTASTTTTTTTTTTTA